MSGKNKSNLKYNSDNEKSSDYSNFIRNNQDKLKDKIHKIPNPKDYPSSMGDGRLFQKFATEYIKKILLEGNKIICSENVSYNFFDYVQTFTESNHSEQQNKLFQDIIGLKNDKARSEDYYFFGDFDMVINSISGQNIKKAMINFPVNIYQYPGISIEDNTNYCMIGEIKKDFYEEIKIDEVKKQFRKYSKILKLLSSEPNLNKIKKRIGINENNKLIVFIVTDGNYYNFEYMRHIRKNYKEDIHSEKDSKMFPDYFQIFDLISFIVPVLLIFVPRTLDDNKEIFTSKSERQIISSLNNEIKDLKNKMKKMEQEQQNKMKKMEQEQQNKINQLKKEQQNKINQLEQQIEVMKKQITQFLGKKRKKIKDETNVEEEEEEKIQKKKKKKNDED